MTGSIIAYGGNGGDSSEEFTGANGGSCPTIIPNYPIMNLSVYGYGGGGGGGWSNQNQFAGGDGGVGFFLYNYTTGFNGDNSYFSGATNVSYGGNGGGPGGGIGEYGGNDGDSENGGGGGGGGPGGGNGGLGGGNGGDGTLPGAGGGGSGWSAGGFDIGGNGANGVIYIIQYNIGENNSAVSNNSLEMNEISNSNFFISDKRLKDNIKDIDTGLDFINKLRPVSYFRTNDRDKKLEYGLIAQELESVLDNNNIINSGIVNKNAEGMYSLRYNDFIPILMKSVQELKIFVDNQETRISNNKKLIKNLEKDWKLMIMKVLIQKKLIIKVLSMKKKFCENRKWNFNWKSFNRLSIYFYKR